MIKAINLLLNIVKIIMLLVCFVGSFYIIITMYRRLDKNLFDSIKNFIPFVFLFIMFSINFILKQKAVTQNIFYNLTCFLGLSVILFAIYRTLCDKNMIVMLRMGYNINFNYFADMIAPMKVILYGLSVSNILLILSETKVFDKLLPDINLEEDK